ncbi:hypothetical protein U1Q18_035472 [Sarracenia purpurea var. burkii]
MNIQVNSSNEVKYAECTHNHAASTGGYVLDGCGEFMPGRSIEQVALCDACGCHRDFHRQMPMEDGIVIIIYPNLLPHPSSLPPPPPPPPARSSETNDV